MRRTVMALAAAIAMIGLVPGSASAADTSRVAVIGDSITNAYGVPPYWGWVESYERVQYGDNIRAYAVNGATIRRWLQQYLPQLDTLPAWQPKTVVIALGGNEYHMTRPAGEYADHLRQLISYVHGKVPNAQIVVLRYHRIIAEFEPNGCDALPNDPIQCIHAVPPNTWDEYGQAMSATAHANGASYIDIANTRDWATYQFDQAHLNIQGNAWFAIDFRNALTAAE